MPNRLPDPTPALAVPPAVQGSRRDWARIVRTLISAKAMNPILWLLLRVAFIAWFGEACARMVVESPVFPSDPTIVIFFLFAFVFFAWRCFSILLRRYKKRKANDDWSASLWCSPILKNPESFWFGAGLAFLTGGLLGVVMVWHKNSNIGVQSLPVALMELSLGGGALAGVEMFRIKKKSGANHSTDLTPASVTPAAGQPARQP
jgi:hypothetical protein